jgi:hypothetical protein
MDYGYCMNEKCRLYMEIQWLNPRVLGFEGGVLNTPCRCGSLLVLLSREDIEEIRAMRRSKDES